MRTRIETLRRTAVATLAAGSLFIGGCVTMDPQMTPDERTDMVSKLQEEVQLLKRAMDEHNARQSKEISLSERVAQIGAKADQLEQEIKALKGKIEEDEVKRRQAAEAQQTGGVDGIKTQIADLATRIESLSTQMAPRGQAKPQPADSKNDQKAREAATSAAAPAPAPDQAQKSAEDTKKLYDTGYNLYRQGKYPEARQAFEDYLKGFPDTPLSDNAWFWIGEAFYNEGQYEKAILTYDKIVREFQKGDKIPSALLKQAFAFDALGDQLDAKILLKKLIKEHPDSEQAAVARRKLEVLGE
ncbi:tol-pal system protein YbgF [bacterium]|nr:MAG: tol-pal system protein YbgF [bacterium]